MKLFTKLLVTLLFGTIAIPLWLTGFYGIKSAIEMGHFPMYEMAIWLDCPEWLPLAIAFFIFAIEYYLIIWKGVIKSHLQL